MLAEVIKLTMMDHGQIVLFRLHQEEILFGGKAIKIIISWLDTQGQSTMDQGHLSLLLQG